MRKGRVLLAAMLGLLATGSRADPVASPDPVLDPFFAAEQGDTRAVLILDDGRVVARRYGPGYSDANRFISWSMNKTLTAMLVGALVADGRLRLDAPAPVAEWRGAGDARGEITLRHLLTMSSGLRHIEVGEPIEHSDTNQVLFVGGTRDMAARAIARPLESRPGEKFEYSSLTSIILAEIVTRTLTPSRDPRTRAEAYRRFATARVLAPAGIRSAFLEFDGAGTQVGGSLLHMTLPDWGRFGTLLLDGRGLAGLPVVAPDWLAFMKTSAATNPGYGGQTWLNRARAGLTPMFPGAPATVASAEGHLGQHVTVSPDSGTGRGVVIVRLGNTRETGSRVGHRLIGRTLARHFARGGPRS
ncbi:MAG TPA: serine hydrolase [Sphingomonas sp.]|jgi:CubicO group peptidase (beta-lactamase class C family)|uniref:serine hydrolase domain-containing protein n=1 Tax=Sphingomonas sp. TaxID=28214 RepID=UPI002EDB84DD